MEGQTLRNLLESYYTEVHQLDEDKRPIYGRGGDMRRTETPLQIYGKQATARDKRTKHNIPKGGTTIDNGDPNRLFSGDYDRGSGNAAKRRAAALKNESYDLYDIILSHLLDEGYADTEQAAEAIMVNMSEDWRESIVEEVLEEGDNYDKNRKRAAQRAAARNAARDAGKTGNVPGVGYVTPRREKETYTDAAGVVRHKSGARNA